MTLCRWVRWLQRFDTMCFVHSQDFKVIKGKLKKRHDSTFHKRPASSYPDMLTVRHMSYISTGRSVDRLKVGL
jgi:hypothetical protein